MLLTFQRKYTYTQFQCGNLKGKDQLEDLGVRGRLILNES